MININGVDELISKTRAAVEARNNRYIKSQTDKVPFQFDDGTTTLTSYLELDTWTPEQAACLVAGIKPETMTYLAKRPNDIAYQEAGSLSCMRLRGVEAWSAETNLSLMGEGMTSFETRMRVLKLWNSQENPPSKVRPAAFVAWCETKKIDTGWLTNAHEWDAPKVAAATDAKRVPVQEQQDTAIMEWLKANGYDPLNLPVGDRGKSGVRSKCRVDMRKSAELFHSDKVFNTAWDRLRAEGKTQPENKKS